ncbi:MAG: 50S ribosomal protein L3 [Patescibacteria group bacterium]|nr:50S ribosomal protein L3 [Patescibacteria group bacterium]
MLDTIFATKRGMTQAWTKAGKRVPVTRCYVDDNIVVGKQKCIAVNNQGDDSKKQPCLIFEIGYGKKKLKNTPKPLKEKIKQSGFSFGVKQIRGVKVFNFDEKTEENGLKIGGTLNLSEILEVGDVVKVVGTSKGKGFAGVVKKYNFKGGPRTHGQRDRERSPGSIGAMTYPGRVWKGKKMPGRMGGERKTVLNLVVLYVDPDKNELWISGPIPGSITSVVQIVKTGEKRPIELNKKASGIEEKPPAEEKPPTEAKAEKEVKKEEKKSAKKQKKKIKKKGKPKKEQEEKKPAKNKKEEK